MSTPPVSVELELDPKELAKLAKDLGPELYEHAVEVLTTDAIMVGDRAAKTVTPVVTGHARRSTVADTAKAELEARYPYFNWLNEGKDRNGREMKTRPGGYGIRPAARQAVESALPALADKAGREILDKWAG